MAETYGVENTRGPGGRPGSIGAQLKPYRSERTVQSELSNAMYQDSGTYQYLAYNPKLRDKLKSDIPTSAKENEMVFNAMKKTHKHAMGNGGKFSSNSDKAGVGMYMQDKFYEDFKDDILKKKKKDKPTVKPPKVDKPEKDYLSPELSHARAMVTEYKSQLLSGQMTSNLYDKDRDPGDQANSFLDKYKLNLGKKNKDGDYQYEPMVP